MVGGALHPMTCAASAGQRPPQYGELIEVGSTPGWVELSQTPKGVYILALRAEADPENRWLWPFTQAIHKAFDAIERHLEDHVDSPAALLTVSESDKFFSNGIDPDGSYSKRINLQPGPKNDMIEGNFLTMPAFSRPLQLPIPTVAAVNGHAFGAGLMFAACHDYRLQREDRGFMCAVEMEIGVGIPPPEMEIFRHVLPLPAFYETVLGCKRWGAADSLRAGLIVKASPAERLFADALAYAETQAKLVVGERKRKLFMHMKDKVKGQVQRMVMDHTFPGGNFPDALAKNQEFVQQVKERYPYLMRHIGEVIEEVPVIPPRKPKAKL
mmetsp:Transcript_107940/g.240907  ORF Transcript_107940/g.240907 Transcript_107940/m.240907 type:complete len:326 (+) Transcript_107940:83-1060(+)